MIRQEDAQQILRCFRGQRNETDDNRQYSPAIRKFALTMHFHSPRAYQYLREKFNNKLPHVSTLRKWFANSDIKGEPGILSEAMNTLKSLGEKMKEKGKQIVISLCCDETSMKQNVQWLHEQKKFSGFVTELRANGECPIASNAFVFMATVVGENVSIPIAYFCVSGLNGDERAAFLNQILIALHEIGVKVMNITFDGLAANFTICEVFGASFDLRELKVFITLPVDGSKIYILLDICHMIKLLRSILGDFGAILDPRRGTINWKYFERLISYREKNDFVTHRLTKHHILYWKNRMNVRLATQVFSKASASTIEYLRKSGDKFFKNSKATEYWTRTLDSLFDIFNAKRIKENEPFKSPLNPNNVQQIFEFFDKTTAYLLGLRLKSKLCVNSRRWTAFVGCIVNMASAKHMYEDYVMTGILPNIPLFYSSQDLLESFFSRVRSLLGCNDNPNAQELKSCMRKLLFYNEISSSVFANCEDNLNILTVSSQKPCQVGTTNIAAENIGIDEYVEANEDRFEEIEEFIQSSDRLNLNIRPQNKEEMTIAYIAGTIEKKVATCKFGCRDCEDLCKQVFIENEKIPGHFIENNNKTQKPCLDTFYICKKAHEIFDENLHFDDFDYKKIHELIFDRLLEENFFPNTDFTHDFEHKRYLIEYIVDEYIRNYATYIAQRVTLAQQKMLVRNKNRKTTHFRGQ